MHLIFGNPAGWWALLGLPALVLIHFLQRKSQRIEVSTLFLLEREMVESRAGRRIERWRNSLLFWLQVLAVLLLAWLLSQPRWVESGTLQRIALVLDSSLSMEAFRADLQNGLRNDTAVLERGASRTEWLLLESELARAPLYRGEDRAAMLAALDQWHPDLGPHDAAPSIRAARVAVGNNGMVFFITDRPSRNGPLPVEAHALAYGHPLDNVGVAAAVAEMHEGQPIWRVLVHNYAAVLQHRAWWIESGGQRSASQTMQLQPGETVSLQGAMPSNSDRITFALEPDAFTLDDCIPIVLPQPKSLNMAMLGPPDFAAALKPVSQMLTDVGATPGATPDVAFVLERELTPSADTSRIFFNELMDAAAPVTRAHPAPEANLLMDELNWSGLIYQAPPPFKPNPDDTALLWDGSIPLIFLRNETGGGQSLVFNLDPRHSNITRLPAFVLLVDRFFEDVRHRKPAPERANFLAGQPLRLVLPALAKTVQLEVNAPDSSPNAASHSTPLTPIAAIQSHAPSPPSFFIIKVDGKVWLDGAAQFPDPRESDFHDAASIPLDAHTQVAREEAHSHPDPLSTIELLALLGALLFSWRETGRK